jgi:hypothetical protein
MAADHVAKPEAEAAEQHQTKGAAQQQLRSKRQLGVGLSSGWRINLVLNLVLDRTNSFSVKNFWHETSSSFHRNLKKRGFCNQAASLAFRGGSRFAK